MSIIRPFRGVLPAEDLAPSIAALPYDVYSSAEARQITGRNPLSFLKIDRAETQFPEGTDLYSEQVYEKARDTLYGMIADGSFIQDKTPCYYIYALTMDGRTQTGIVGCASIDDYENGVILRHENTLEEKERDRFRHIDTCSAQTGPIFLAYRSNKELQNILIEIKRMESPLFDFTAEDGIRHRVWRIGRPDYIENISQIFAEIPHIYIADGHHRAASAVKVGLKRRTEDPGFSGNEEYNFFLSVLFASDELKIYDYNRVVIDMNGYTFDGFLDKIRSGFEITEKEGPYRPQRKGEFGLYGDGKWYRLRADARVYPGTPVGDLDVSVLQENILAPVFGITNPKSDPRIRFVGGIRGLKELEREADRTGGAAFAMYPTSMDELLSVADAGMLMPPKSTWFEPKLRSGLFIHLF